MKRLTVIIAIVLLMMTTCITISASGIPTVSANEEWTDSWSSSTQKIVFLFECTETGLYDVVFKDNNKTAALWIDILYETEEDYDYPLYGRINFQAHTANEYTVEQVLFTEGRTYEVNLTYHTILKTDTTYNTVFNSDYVCGDGAYKNANISVLFKPTSKQPVVLSAQDNYVQMNDSGTTWLEFTTTTSGDYLLKNNFDFTIDNFYGRVDVYEAEGYNYIGWGNLEYNNKIFYDLEANTKYYLSVQLEGTFSKYSKFSVKYVSNPIVELVSIYLPEYLNPFTLSGSSNASYKVRYENGFEEWLTFNEIKSTGYNISSLYYEGEDPEYLMNDEWVYSDWRIYPAGYHTFSVRFKDEYTYFDIEILPLYRYWDMDLNNIVYPEDECQIKYEDNEWKSYYWRVKADKTGNYDIYSLGGFGSFFSDYYTFVIDGTNHRTGYNANDAFYMQAGEEYIINIRFRYKSNVYDTVKWKFSYEGTATNSDSLYYLYTSDGMRLVNCNPSVTSVTIPSSVNGRPVTSIGKKSFYNCTNLKNVVIPSSVTYIEEGAFWGCSSLESITVPYMGESVYSDNTFGHIFGITPYTGGVATNQYSSGDKTYYIPSSLKSVTVNGSSVPYCAFENCKNLTSIILSNTVNTIDRYAFENCTSLESITIPNSVTEIGYVAFAGCENLKNITIPNSVLSIGDYAFFNCASLSSVSIGNGVTIIGESLFSNCISLKSVTIPDNITVIGSAAFSNCTSLTSITIPESVTSIGDSAFYNCTSLTRVSLSGGVKNLGQYAFYGCTSLTDVNIPSSIEAIPEGAFAFCESLINVNIASGLRVIDHGAFYDCTSMKDITIPSSVITIFDSAFSGCSALESITLPFIGGSTGATDTLGYIFGENAYDGGVETKQYYAPGQYNTYYIPESLKSVTVLGGDIPYGAFDGCKSLTSITISDETESIGNCAFRNCIGIAGIKITSGVKTIGAKAFYGCSALQSIIMPDSVNSIGDEVFYGCAALSNVKLSKSLKSISTKAFYNCSSLTKLTVPDEIESVGDYAFYNCTAMKEAVIPVGLVNIGTGAFRKCSGIETVYYGGSEAQWTALANRPECDNVIFNYVPPAYTPGDIDGVEGVTDADAVYLLMHTFFPDMYPIA